MSNKTGLARDAFTFSLGGLTTIASFVPAPALAHDRIRQGRDGRTERDRPCRDTALERQPADCASAA